MFRVLSIIFIFTTSTIIGFYQSSRLARRRKLLKEHRDFLQRLETEIGYFKEPLPDILRRMHSLSNDAVNLMLRHCLLQLETGTEPIEKIWRNAVLTAYENEPLIADDLAIITKCGSFIGQSDYNSQKGHFLLLKQELEQQICDAEHVYRTKGSLYSKAGVSVGAVLAIALI